LLILIVILSVAKYLGEAVLFASLDPSATLRVTVTQVLTLIIPRASGRNTCYLLIVTC